MSFYRFEYCLQRLDTTARGTRRNSLRIKSRLASSTSFHLHSDPWIHRPADKKRQILRHVLVVYLSEPFPTIWMLDVKSTGPINQRLQVYFNIQKAWVDVANDTLHSCLIEAIGSSFFGSMTRLYFYLLLIKARDGGGQIHAALPHSHPGLLPQ